MDIKKYRLSDGRVPFDQWMGAIRDRRARARILVRLDRILLGNFGDVKAVGEGVSELRIDEGKGYRVYFGQEGRAVVLLLCGGDKSTQQSDIKRAKEYWRHYREQSY